MDVQSAWMKSVWTSEIIVNIWTNNILCKLYLQDNLSQRIWLSKISRPATACNCSLFRSWFPFPAHFYEGKTVKSWPTVANRLQETLHDVFAEAAYEKIYWKLNGAAGSTGNPVWVEWPQPHGLFFFNAQYSTIKTICANMITHSERTLNRFQFRLNCSYAQPICIFTTFSWFSTKHAIWRESPLVLSQLPRFACAPTKLYFLLGKFEMNSLQQGFNHRDGT